MKHIPRVDPELAAMIQGEEERIETTLNLIAAENHAPAAIMEALGSVLNTKTIEGYPGNRFHAGCVHADAVENLAIERAKALFGAEYANVQPHSGTSANLAVYFSVLDVGDKVLAMHLPHGGHLSHGHRASITSRCFSFAHYSLDEKTERIDYEGLEKMAREFRPKMIVAGASSYPRLIDYPRISRIAKEVSAYFLVDMAHLAGLVAGGAIPSPVAHCDFVTFTCYKTLKGGRGGVILCKQRFGKKLDSTIFPGCQGTSAVNLIAAKALVFKMAMEPAFAIEQEKTVENARCLAAALAEKGFRIVTGGTDNHQVLLDLSAKEIGGGQAEKRLEAVGIIANRNVIAKDASNPARVSGLRLGTSAATARGMGREEMETIAGLIDKALGDPEGEAAREVAGEVANLCRRFPVYT